MARSTGFSPKVSAAIKERSGGVCEVQMQVETLAQHVALTQQQMDKWLYRGCVGARAVHKHHRRNRGSGSTKRPETNYASAGLHACVNCHDWIGANPAISYQVGWLVRQNHMPADVPVLYRGRMCLLGDDGSIAPYEQKAS